LRRLRTIIVDDEPLALRLLESILADFAGVELIDKCRNGREAVRAVQQHAPDLLILDIQMPGMTGFDVIKYLQADLVPMVIFCTAYQRYALDAFDLYAVDYLLKPISANRLQLAVDRANARYQKEHERREEKGMLLGAINEIARRVHGKSEKVSADDAAQAAADQKIAIKDVDSITMLDVDDIVWVDAAGDYMCVHANGVIHIMRSTLKSLVEKLQPVNFKRIHRSTIVNLKHIEKVTPLPRGEYILELDCGESLKVSRNYRDAIRSYLDAH
jgi:two-component system LytT family response regulator